MIPNKLKPGDEIRIIAPSRSLGIISKDVRKIATERLEKLGFKVTFGKNVEEMDEFKSSSIESRISDLHEAFSDKNVKAVMTVIGGFNCNQLLRYINWDIIKNNPKIFCGYSDTTALANAIYAKTELVNYSGPAYSSFGMLKGFDYNQKYLKKCLMESKEFQVEQCEKFSEDEWYINQENRKFYDNEGMFVINEGEAKGNIIGANLCTFNLLHGTEYMPDFEGKILFIEDCVESGEDVFVVNFDRDLQSIIHQPEFEKVKGIVIGRFEKSSGMTKEKITKIIKTKKELDKIPVIAGADFGHTHQMITFPLGGKCRISAKQDQAELHILEH